MLEKIIPVQGGLLHCFTNGKSGDPLFFLHGAGLDHRMFSAQYRFFDREFPIYAWDARLHGKSRQIAGFSPDLLVQDLQAVFDRESIERAVLIGHSMGGSIAQEFARRYPGRVNGLVVIGSARIDRPLTLLEKVTAGVAGPLLRTVPYGWFAHVVAKTCSRRPEVQTYIAECLQAMGKRRLIEVLRRLPDFVHVRENGELPGRLLLICGEKERMPQVKKSMAAWGGERAAEFHLLSHERHNVHQDAPDRVNRLIHEFLSRLFVEQVE